MSNLTIYVKCKQTAEDLTISLLNVPTAY